MRYVGPVAILLLLLLHGRWSVFVQHLSEMRNLLLRTWNEMRIAYFLRCQQAVVM